MSERECGERSGLLVGMKNTKKKSLFCAAAAGGFIQNGVVLHVQNYVVLLSEEFGFRIHERQIVRLHETTRRFSLIRTTGRLLRTDDTPFASYAERQCTRHTTTRRFVQTLNDRAFQAPDDASFPSYAERLVVRLPFSFSLFFSF